MLEGPRRLAWGDGAREPSGLRISLHVRPVSVPPLSPLHLASPGSRCVFPKEVEFRDPGTSLTLTLEGLSGVLSINLRLLAGSALP